MEPYKSRLLGGLPFVSGSTIVIGDEDSTNWGEIMPDIDFSKFDSSDVALYGSSIKLWGKMSYRTLMETYYSIKNRTIGDLPTSAATRNEKIEEEKRISLIKFVETHKLSTVLEYDDPCVCPNPIKRTIESVQWVSNIGNKYTIPYLSFGIGLTQTTNLVGSYTIVAKDWVAGKRYYIGDICKYDNQVYQLSDTAPEFSSAEDILPMTAIETKSLFVSGAKVLYYKSQVKNPNIPEWIYPSMDTVDELVVGGYAYAKIGGFYYERPYWAGATHEGTSEIYFDELTDDGSGFVNVGSDGSTTHWKLRTDLTYIQNSTATSYSDDTLSILGKPGEFTEDVNKVSDVVEESRLDEFFRRKKTIDDNGSILPGYLVNKTDSTLALLYGIGSITNITTHEDVRGETVYIGDFLKTVAVYEDFTLQNRLFSVESDVDFVSSLNALQTGFTGVIEFIYYLGVNLKELQDGSFEVDGQITEATTDVLKYVDRYNFVISPTEVYEIDEQEKIFKFVDIDYDSGSNFTTLENLDNLTYLTKLSNVEYHTLSATETSGKSSNFLNSPFIMEDYKLGVSFIDNNADGVAIDRGNAAAFERHLRLSEVKTMQDLEQYGNGFFTLKK